MLRCKTLLLLALSALLLPACLPPPYPPASPLPLSPVAVATEAPIATAAPPATPIPTPAEAAIVVAAVEPQVQGEHASPDRRWRATIFSYPCVLVGDTEMGYDELRLIRVASGADPLITHQLRNCQGLGAIGLGGLFWSTNSRYFYFTDAREGSPDGGCGPYVRPTLRLDTATFAVQRLGSGPLSPDRSRLATWQDNALMLWDVETGEAVRVEPPASVGTYVASAWSPDSAALAYLQMERPCPPAGRALITRVDLPGLTQTVLLDTAELNASPHFVLDLTWDTADTLHLVDDTGEAWKLDVTTGALERGK